MTCQNCGANLRQGVLFCGECGSPVPPAAPICRNCGAELPEGTKFCGVCGAPVGAAPSGRVAAVGAPGARGMAPGRAVAALAAIAAAALAVVGILLFNNGGGDNKSAPVDAGATSSARSRETSSASNHATDVAFNATIAADEKGGTATVSALQTFVAAQPAGTPLGGSVCAQVPRTAGLQTKDGGFACIGWVGSCTPDHTEQCDISLQVTDFGTTERAQVFLESSAAGKQSSTRVGERAFEGTLGQGSVLYFQRGRYFVNVYARTAAVRDQALSIAAAIDTNLKTLPR